MRPPRERLDDLGAALLVAAFIAVGLVGLDTVPTVQLDEVWQAAPGYGFFTTGRFATPIFAGFFGMERHYYAFMPLSPLLLGASLRLFGLGIFQLRLVPLLLCAAVLILTYVLGRRALSREHGLFATLVLTTWPVAAARDHLPTGIPMADLARIGRYDIAVPAFGLAALVLLLGRQADETSPSWIRFLLAGLLIGLATLSHVYGAAWLLAVLVSFFGRRTLGKSLVAIAGFALALAPWLLFVASGWRDFFAQNRNYAPRFRLTDAGFYRENLAREAERYRHVLDALASGSPAAVFFLLLLAAGLVLLVRRGFSRGPDRSLPTRSLLATLLIFGGFFALLLEQKNRMYLASLWPLFALAVSLPLVELARRGRWGRPVVTAICLVAAAQGLRAYVELGRSSRSATPYPALLAKLRTLVPPGSRILAIPDTWLGLAATASDYRAINVPMYLASPGFVKEPVPFADAADAIGADVLIVDRGLARFLLESKGVGHPFHALGGAMAAWIESRRGPLLGSFDDPTYGRYEVLRLTPRP